MTIEILLVGTAGAILAAWVIKELRHRFHRGQADRAPREGTPLSGLGVKARLRDFYRLAVLLEEESMTLYKRMSSQAADPAVQKLCAVLAAEEAVHRERFQSQLERWHALPPNPAEWPAFLEAAKNAGLFGGAPGPEASEAEMARFALGAESKAAEFYSHFEAAFPDEWRRTKMAELVAEERAHERKLRAAYPGA